MLGNECVVGLLLSTSSDNVGYGAGWGKIFHFRTESRPEAEDAGGPLLAVLGV
jgi:hypothetical protein